MTKRRPTSRTPLLTPALAKPHRLGDAVSRALGRTEGLAAPAVGMTSRKLSHGNRWATPAQWQHGRVLHAPAPVTGNAWEYPNLSRMGSAMAHQSGIALLELMLVIGVVAIGTAGVVATYRVVDNNRKVNREVEHATAIAQNIVAQGVTRGDFSIINQENALRDGVFPQDMLDADGNPKTAWGGDVLVTATNIDGKPNWGTVLTFEGVPASACAKLVSQAATGFYAVSVNDETVRSNYGPLDTAAVARLCGNDGARVQFTYAKHGGAGESFDNVSPCTVPSPETDVIVNDACPSGQLGTVIYTTNYVCNTPYGPATDLPAAETSNTCIPACVLPTPSTQQVDETRTATQTLACPSGQSSTTGGTNGITQSRTETRYKTRDAFCPPPAPGYTAPTGPYSWTPYTPYTPWVATTPWTTTGNTCAANCVVPSPSTETETETRNNSQTLACPAGQLGGITQTRPERRTRTREASCPATTGPVYWTAWSPWSSWTATAPWTTSSNTCAPECVAPQNTVQSQAGTPQTQTLGCPSGQSGAITQTRTVTQYRTVSYSCPTPTGPVSTTYSPWGTPASTYGSWTTTSNTCAPNCVAPADTTQTQSQTANCLTGRVTPAGATSFTQTHSRAVTYDCPAATGAYTTTYAPWSAWSPTESSACAPRCVAPADTNTTESRTFTCPTNQLITTAGPSQYDASGPQTRVRTNTYDCPAPTGSWSANPATYTPWTPAYTCATRCTAPADTTQTAATTPQTRTLDCPAGNYGTGINQSRPMSHTRTVNYNCPTPVGAYTTTYGTWGAAFATPPGTWATTDNNCTACPAPSTQVQNDWEARSGACPSGQTGSITWEEIRTRSRSVSYSCPAGTTTLPTPTYGTYTPFTWTGTKRNIVNNCTTPAPCVVAASTLQRSWTDPYAGESCGPSYVPAGTYAHGAYVITTYHRYTKMGTWDGRATWQCVDGTISSSSPTSGRWCTYEPALCDGCVPY